jgi:hypothetical protein
MRKCMRLVAETLESIPDAEKHRLEFLFEYRRDVLRSRCEVCEIVYCIEFLMSSPVLRGPSLPARLSTVLKSCLALGPHEILER